MVNPSLALLMPNLKAINVNRRKAFLAAIDAVVPANTIILSDASDSLSTDSFKNIKLILFSHGKDFADTLRMGLAAGMDLGAERFVTFEDYALSNATWFLGYLNAGNVIESNKRGFVEMLVTEITNLLSFGNIYNGFSMNRILTREAAESLKTTKSKGKAFLLESMSILNAKGIKTIEVIKPTKKVAPEKLAAREAVDSVIKSINRSSILFSMFGSLAYLANILTVYASLSLGWFYPLAVFIGGEINTLSNFIMNEKINFKNRGFMSSVYRLGKFNALSLTAIVFDVILIAYLSSYMSVLGKNLFTALSIISIVVVSIISLFVTTKMVWSKNNNLRVQT
jgi:putative flippase GtrA